MQVVQLWVFGPSAVLAQIRILVYGSFMNSNIIVAQRRRLQILEQGVLCPDLEMTIQDHVVLHASPSPLSLPLATVWAKLWKVRPVSNLVISVHTLAGHFVIVAGLAFSPPWLSEYQINSFLFTTAEYQCLLLLRKQGPWYKQLQVQLGY